MKPSFKSSVNSASTDVEGEERREKRRVVGHLVRLEKCQRLFRTNVEKRRGGPSIDYGESIDVSDGQK
jgi:hypothetical protein